MPIASTCPLSTSVSLFLPWNYIHLLLSIPEISFGSRQDTIPEIVADPWPLGGGQSITEGNCGIVLAQACAPLWGALSIGGQLLKPLLL